MIETGVGTVNILYADGTSAFFDPEELRLRLEKSFAAAGRTDPAVAGEIVLAVEYALSCRDAENSDSGLVIHAGEIDECVVRILEDTGYPDAARHFRGTGVTSGDFGKLTPDGVEPYLAEKLQLTGPAGSGKGTVLRQLMSEQIREVPVILPPLKYCTDNATMIAAAAFHYLKHQEFVDYAAASRSSLSIEERIE